MKHILTIAVLILSSLLAPPSHAASPVSVTLTLPHNNVLPGVPFDIIVTYTNVSDQPLTVLGALATLVVTFANGDTVVMNQPDANDQWDLSSAMPLRLAPGESGQQSASWENGSIPNWFQYGWFSRPGTYGIALDLRVTDEDENVLATVRTSPVALHRVEPIGVDAELWKRMQEMSGGAWADNSFAATKPGFALAGEIIQLHPTSGYYPYALALRAFTGVVDKNHIPVLLEAAQRFPTSPAYPYLLNAAANCARYAGTVAAREGNMAEAKKYLTLADTKYREALATKSVAIRRSSELGLQQVASGLDRATKKQVR